MRPAWLHLGLTGLIALSSCQSKLALRVAGDRCDAASAPCAPDDGLLDGDKANATTPKMSMLSVPAEKITAGQPITIVIKLAEGASELSVDQLIVSGGTISQLSRVGDSYTVIIIPEGGELAIEVSAEKAASITMSPDQPPSIRFDGDIASPSVGSWPLSSVSLSIVSSDDLAGEKTSFYLSATSTQCRAGVETDAAWQAIAANLSRAEALDFQWNASSLNPGTYAICVKTKDLANNSTYKLQTKAITTLPPRFSWLGSKDGGLSSPQKIAYYDGAIFVAKADGARVLKFDAATGAYLGWIGGVKRAPSGGAAGCASLERGDVTPGWCMGGEAESGYAAGAFTRIVDIGADELGNLYVATFDDAKVSRFDAATGAHTGWIGTVDTTPTGGASGCTSLSIWQTTPGWCLGGTARRGSQFSGDPSLYDIWSLAISSSGEIYVNVGSAVKKYDSSGAYVGWIGRVMSNFTPTGGVAGCTTTPNDSPAPGWCQGGMFSNAIGWQPGAFYYAIREIAVDGNDHLYVTDNWYAQRFSATTGAFTGWIGTVATSPTGGGTGCAGASVGTRAPDWCTGGAPESFSYGYTIQVVNGTTAYGGGGGIRRLNVAGVTETGWTGIVGSVPTGGGAACLAAAPGSWTPAWCTGGSATYSGLGDLAIDRSNDVLFVPNSSGIIHRIDGATGALLGGITLHETSPSQWRTSGAAAPGSGDGMLNAPTATLIDSGKILVSDGPRIVGFDLKTGSFTGWTGRVGATPTGGAPTCPSLGFGSMTPAGGCKGGGAVSTSPFYDLEADATHYYVLRSSQIEKYDRNWQYLGWIGVVGTTPTGGAAGCNATTAGQQTPGWCTGGASQPSYSDGGIGVSQPVMASSGNYLYLAQYSRITRYEKTTGAYAGWIGEITATTPTGGMTGCTTATAGAATPGWCLGGGTASSSSLQGFNNLMSLAADGKGNLLAADWGTNSIRRINVATGAQTGWLGLVLTTPTGGAAGCTDAGPLDITPGWCTGGAPNSDTMSGELRFRRPQSIGAGGASLYFTEANNRVAKVNLDTGAYRGWQGFVDQSPTGGAAGCVSVASGDFTPGWCEGGSALATMDVTGGIAVDPFGSVNLIYLPGTSGRVIRIYD